MVLPGWSAPALAAGIAWAAGGLAWSAGRALRGIAAPFAARAGSPAAGVFSMLAAAMVPSRKESVRRHPVSFALGGLLHAGVFVLLAGLVTVACAPAALGAVRAAGVPAAAVALLAAAALAVRRGSRADLRRLSVPDDYLAVSLVILFLLAGSAALLEWIPGAAAIAATLVLLAYVPAGKLRHMAFFFVARADLGRRLGYRGVLPAAAPARRTGVGRGAA
jgi:hypothetical protein